MRKGASLVEAMLSLFLGGFILIAGNNFLLSVKGVSKRVENSVISVSEKSLSLFQITSIVKKAGEGIPVEFGVEIKDDILTIRKTEKKYYSLKNADEGDFHVELHCPECKSGKKLLIGGEIYKISEVEGELITLEGSLRKTVDEGEEIALLKEYHFNSNSEGLYMKIDRGNFQLISKDIFDISFSMFTENVVKFSGKERRGKKIQDFEYYIYLPYISTNGGLK